MSPQSLFAMPIVKVFQLAPLTMVITRSASLFPQKLWMSGIELIR